MEIWDAYDRDGRRLGVDLVRGEPVPSGMYHLVCDVILRHRNGNFLLMRRDPRKECYPGQYELTAGGSALKGEDALACVRRELFEETGVRCETFSLVRSVVREEDRGIFYLFYAETDCDPASVRLQLGETVEYCWVNRQELERRLESPSMIHFMKRRYRLCVEKGLIR